MTMIIRIKRFIEELDDKTLYQYFAVVVGLVFLFLMLLFYVGHRRVAGLQNEIKSMNRYRNEARILLGKSAVVNERKKKVDEILAQDPTFLIKETFLREIESLNLTGNSSKEIEISSPQDLKNGYSEIRLDASFTGITMQQLCDLIFRLEKNQRVFIKEVSITKNFSRPTVEVTLIIATLQSTAEL